AQDDVVHEPQLLRPVAERERPQLLVGERLVLDAEEPLEGLEPHLELEELGGVPSLGHPLRPLAELAAEEIRPLGAGRNAVLGVVAGHRCDDYSEGTTGAAVSGVARAAGPVTRCTSGRLGVPARPLYDERLDLGRSLPLLSPSELVGAVGARL